MKVKKVRRICDVKGCSSKDTYSIAKKYGTGMTVIACKECLKDALTEIEKLEATESENNVVEKTTADESVELEDSEFEEATESEETAVSDEESAIDETSEKVKQGKKSSKNKSAK